MHSSIPTIFVLFSTSTSILALPVLDANTISKSLNGQLVTRKKHANTEPPPKDTCKPNNGGFNNGGSGYGFCDYNQWMMQITSCQIGCGQVPFGCVVCTSGCKSMCSKEASKSSYTERTRKDSDYYC
jgi:hypothetical protein